MQPAVSILNKDFVYRNAAATDVQATWRRHGWMTKSERDLLNVISQQLEQQMAAQRSMRFKRKPHVLIFKNRQVH